MTTPAEALLELERLRSAWLGALKAYNELPINYGDPEAAHHYKASKIAYAAFEAAILMKNDTLLAALRRVVEAEAAAAPIIIPTVWTEEERDALDEAYRTASAKHGHYETLFAVAKRALELRGGTRQVGADVEALTAAKIRAGKGAPSAAASDVLAERRRQVEVEGWTPEHDDVHNEGEMAMAAAVYAYYSTKSQWIRDGAASAKGSFADNWPWDSMWFKLKSPRRDLVRAGALIIAEIERLDRISRAAPEPQP